MTEPQNSTQVAEPLLESATKSQIATQVIVGSGALASVVSSMSSLSSPQGLWMSMNQFQLIMLLLLTNAFVPFKIVDYLDGMKSTTCSFGFIPFRKIPGLSRITDWMDYDISNSKLDYFDVTSGSTVVNIFSLL